MLSTLNLERCYTDIFSCGINRAIDVTVFAIIPVHIILILYLYYPEQDKIIIHYIYTIPPFHPRGFYTDTKNPIDHNDYPDGILHADINIIIIESV